MWIEVSRIDHKDLMDPKRSGEESESVRNRIRAARAVQEKRFEKMKRPIKLNSEMNAKNLIEYVELAPKVKDILNQSALHLDLSARAYHRVVKLARTIADLEEKENVESSHILEALQYRPKKMSL